METDPEGTFAFLSMLAIGFLVGLVSAAVETVSQIKEKGIENVNWGKVAFNGVVGMATSMLMASPLGAVATGLGVGGVGFIQSVGNDLFDNNGNFASVNWGKAALLGTVSGVLSGAGKGLKNLTKLVNYDKFIQNSSAAVKGLMLVGKVANTIISGITAAVRNLAKGLINFIC